MSEIEDIKNKMRKIFEEKNTNTFSIKEIVLMGVLLEDIRDLIELIFSSTEILDIADILPLVPKKSILVNQKNNIQALIQLMDEKKYANDSANTLSMVNPEDVKENAEIIWEKLPQIKKPVNLLILLVRIEGKDGKAFRRLRELRRDKKMSIYEIEKFEELLIKIEIKEEINLLKKEANLSGLPLFLEKVENLDKAFNELSGLKGKVELLESVFDGEKWEFIADKAKYIGSIDANRILINAYKTLIEANSKRIDSTQKLIGVLVAIISMLFGALFTLVFTI